MKKYTIFLCLLISIHTNAQIYETNEGSHKGLTVDEILKTLFICVAVIVVVQGIVYGIAQMQKGTVSMSKPLRILSFTTKCSADKVMKIIINYANQSNYKVDDFDENKFIIVLSDSPTFNPLVKKGYGFFYPIYLTRQNSGEIYIEIGISSKLIQWGPIVSRSHEKCFNGIKAAIFANQ